MVLPPQQWMARGVIAYGLWMLAAPPKTGKSWWVLQLLLSLASGGVAFGNIRVDPLESLYLALEDTPHRLKYRLEQLCPEDASWQDSFHFLTEAPPLPDGLISSLRTWHEQHPGCRVIAIDTLARIRGPRKRTEDLYSGDSRVIAELQELTKELNVSIILVHHTRKSQGTDRFEEISGSHGITGPLDGMLVFKRTRGDANATLYVTGRDVEERELAFQFDNRTGLWTHLGEASLWHLSKERRAILQTLGDANGGLTPKQVAKTADLDYGSTRHLLVKMRDDGLGRVHTTCYDRACSCPKSSLI